MNEFSSLSKKNSIAQQKDVMYKFYTIKLPDNNQSNEWVTGGSAK